jgi:hypothetical protein
MRGGRAHERIEHETLNTLKNQSYPLEHNSGHGYQHLSVVLAVVTMDDVGVFGGSGPTAVLPLVSSSGGQTGA